MDKERFDRVRQALMMNSYDDAFEFLFDLLTRGDQENISEQIGRAHV